MKTLISIFLFFILFAGGAIAVSAQTVYMVCTWDTSSLFKDSEGREKFERRFYISGTVSMTLKDYLKKDSEGDRLEGLCAGYLTNTVEKAAIERHEQLENGSITIIRNIELSGENAGSKNPYKFGTKEDVEKKRDESIKDALDAGRFRLWFDWDVTGKNESIDYKSELKRAIESAPSQRKP